MEVILVKILMVELFLLVQVIVLFLEYPLMRDKITFSAISLTVSQPKLF